MGDARRGVPSVDRLLGDPAVAALIAARSRPVVVRAARRALERARAAAAGGSGPEVGEIVAAIRAELGADRLSPRHVINATGVVIHTNLGRAPLSEEAAAAAAAAARSYTDLEYDLESGLRGSRHAHVAAALRVTTGAEAAIAVNNNAAAVLLALCALAAGREVIVSRGQAVEIGGGFRIPDVLRQSGCRLVEVGTTNRTYAADYEAAIGPETALLLHVHRSNFRVSGFVASVAPAELAAVGRRAGVPVLDDNGSGALLDTARFGLAHEPTVGESLASGVDLVCFSGDKLLGGPQAGIIAGRAELVERARRHPLARAVRVDKATIAALAATLRHYERGEVTEKVPVWRMIASGVDEIGARAERWRAQVADLGVRCEVVAERSAVGGGSLPDETLPTRALAVQMAAPERLAARLRSGEPPIVGRVRDGALVLDPRTVLPGDDDALAAGLRAALAAENIDGDDER